MKGTPCKLIVKISHGVLLLFVIYDLVSDFWNNNSVWQGK